MCDMQKMPRDDACRYAMSAASGPLKSDTRKIRNSIGHRSQPQPSEEEGDNMNFAAFSAVGATGTHFVTTNGQMPAKMQQGMANNSMPQVVGMVGGVAVSEGMQYSGIQATPQFISVPITLPGAKPGEPQSMVQIQVLNPNLLQPQQQKYQMQIPIQGYQGGGAVLTVAYAAEASDAAMQLMAQNPLAENVIMTTLPQEMQLVQQGPSSDDKSQIQHQVFITPNQQIIINGPDDNKALNNNTTTNNNNEDIVIKEECEDATNDDESSQGTEASENTPWTMTSSQQDLVKYLNSLPPQQTQTLPLSLQQFLKLNPNPSEIRKDVMMEVEVAEEDKKEAVAEAIIGEDGSVRIQNKKKKKYKKKPPKPARPKPGQVVIATAADGTPIFCCPECQMAYPEKEQLEIHLGVHKIARRFICGICGAGLKRKEHLERHKLGHNPERPYVCGVCRKGFKRREHLNLHIVIHSGVKTEMCTECGKGFYRKDHLRKHARSHETRRARDESQANTNTQIFKVEPGLTPPQTPNTSTILPEITIHVPTSSNLNVPVQINIPQHVVSSLEAAQTQQQQNDTQAQLEALLAQHS